MMCGLVVGTVIKVGEPPPVRQTTLIFGKPMTYGGFSGMSGHYTVALESARNEDKPMPVMPVSAFGYDQPEATVDKVDGTYALPFRWVPDTSVGESSVTIDLSAFYEPKDSNINRRRIARGTLVKRTGSARMKTAYLVNLDDAGYPDVNGIPALASYSQALWKAVWDITTNSRLPSWDEDRQKYSQMLCAGVDVRISAGGVSS